MTRTIHTIAAVTFGIVLWTFLLGMFIGFMESWAGWTIPTSVAVYFLATAAIAFLLTFS